MSKILISAPIYNRAWILPYYLEAIEKQDIGTSNLGFIFELGPDDDETHDLLWDWHCAHPEFILFDGQINGTRRHTSHEDGTRTWTHSKYENMVIFRNSLLERATAHADKFDYLFSLDSDLILEDPSTISKLVEDCEQNPEIGVVSPLSYMTPRDRGYPSIMYWDKQPGGRAFRKHDRFKANELYEVDIVMAAVFMTKPVFTQTRYYWHKQGEDLGFATDLARLGFRSFTDTRIYVPHMMHRADLTQYLETGEDMRNPNKILTM